MRSTTECKYEPCMKPKIQIISTVWKNLKIILKKIIQLMIKQIYFFNLSTDAIIKNAYHEMTWYANPISNNQHHAEVRYL